MSRHEYSIVDWDKKYEVSQAKRVLGPLTWVALPTTHDDLAFRRLMAMDDGAALYGAWIMIVQIAAKCSPRGVLADGRHPLTAADLAMRTGVPEALFSKALQILASKNFGWIKRSRYRASSEHGLSLVGAQCTLQDSTGQHKTKHHTTASGGSRTEGSPGAGQDLGIPIPINLDVPDFLTTWHRWVTYLRQKSIRVSPMTLESQLTQLATIGPVEAIAAIEQSITKGWLSLNPTSHNSPSKGPAPLTEEELTTWRATA